MKALIEKSTGKVIGAWPDFVEVSVSGVSDETHEWVDDLPETPIEEVTLYTRVKAGEYVKSETVDHAKSFGETP